MGVCLDYHHHQTNVNRQFRVFSSSLVEYQQSLFKKKRKKKVNNSTVGVLRKNKYRWHCERESIDVALL
jgi:hypothetical protein